MRRLALALVSAPLAIPLLACLATPAPEGDLVGDFLVRGVLEANECGAAVPANETIELRVQLRRDGNLATWRTPNTAIVHGTHTDGSYAFSFGSVLPVFEADPVLGTPACNLDQIERIEVSAESTTQGDAAVDAGAIDAGAVDAGAVDAGAVDAGAVDAGAVDAGAVDAGAVDAGASMPDASVPTTAIGGQSVLRYRPTAGSGCAPLLAIYGGPFDDLPCEVRYRLYGTPTEPLFD
ncbi:MAG: hypothetical protein MUE69_25350 [Myxococcota bacterium]|jgi:hypothetical protein|nr:hypothetical protein [Myxococcota bacterium]